MESIQNPNVIAGVGIFQIQTWKRNMLDNISATSRKLASDVKRKSDEEMIDVTESPTVGLA